MRHRDADHIKYKLTLPLIFLLATAALYFFHTLTVEKQRVANIRQTVEDLRLDAFQIAAAESPDKVSYELERFSSRLNTLKSIAENNPLYGLVHEDDNGLITSAEFFLNALSSKESIASVLKNIDEEASHTLVRLNEFQHKLVTGKIKIEYAILFFICLLIAIHFYLVDAPMKRELLKNAREKEVCNSTIKKLAERDALTNLPGRMKFYEESEREVSAATRYGSNLTLIKMDIHDFKAINHDNGQKAGDKILAGFARTVRKHLRRPDSFFRVGGDKFIILAPHTTIKNAENLTVKIDKLIKSSKALNVVPFSVNTGIAACGPGETAKTLLEKVDSALKESKKHGPGSVYIYPEETQKS
ncbi:GGDEF domain-containing protein [Maridesulfovibrio hydrothermalis]|uniref:diguanylate cyclase n=1 Tax=Maridesulfovibrio hydrothermalis AM13 = DSM 14728 TaxID=1121451 RepID=L0RH03_9BACT|nr:GGDEF domain-containing protein [Maridesulfovibrio hydrothermalis]CCO24861.1 Diguanylate cyclase [Maridesulfovibrio hydrothermalis AM13 = DSM 14728]